MFASHSTHLYTTAFLHHLQSMTAIMVSMASLKGLLLFLLTQSAAQKTVDIDTLGRIVSFFDKNYQPFSVENHPQQYAVAINVDETQCEKDFVPSQNNFLTKEGPDVYPLYNGQELIVARVIKTDKFNIHAERILLNPTEEHKITPMEDLLNKLKEKSCTIFYSLKSPCFKNCLNEDSEYNILAGLENWSKHPSVKAFVFKDVFWTDKKSDELQKNFKKIVAHVPLYRCVSETKGAFTPDANKALSASVKCYACKGDGSTPIDVHCLTN